MIGQCLLAQKGQEKKHLSVEGENFAYSLFHVVFVEFFDHLPVFLETGQFI